MSMMKIKKTLQPSTMEIKRIVQHNHQQCKLNDEHNKTQNTQTQQWILECSTNTIAKTKTQTPMLHLDLESQTR